MTSPRPDESPPAVDFGRREASPLRHAASILVAALCGYFSLGTSCGDRSVEEQVTGTVRFESGQAAASLRVRADAVRLILQFDEEVEVFRDGEPTRSPDDDPYETDGTTCGVVPGSYSTSAPAEGTTCVTTPVPADELLFEIVRSDTTQAAEVTVTAVAQTRTDCDGKFEGSVGVSLVVEDP